MAKQKKRSRRKKNLGVVRTLQFEVVGLVLLTFSIISLANLGNASKAGRLVAEFFMGEWSFILLLGLLILSVYLIYKRQVPDFLSQRLFGVYLITIAILLLVHISAVTNHSIPYDNDHRSVILQTWEHFWTNVSNPAENLELGGGMIGAIVYATSDFLFDTAGSKIVAVIMAIIGFVLITNLSIKDTMVKGLRPFFRFTRKQWRAIKADVKEHFTDIDDDETEEQVASSKVKQPDNDQVVTIPLEVEPKEIVISDFSNHVTAEVIDQQPIPLEPLTGSQNQVETENVDYVLPPIGLLGLAKKVDQRKAMAKINQNAKKLEQTLQSFGVNAKVTQIHLGPAVTQYEVYPEAGVKVSRIVALTDDIALALAAKDIRIEAPIPGKSAVGIEVPNAEVSMVSLREVLETAEDRKKNILKFSLGRDISGAPITAELNKMPHLLVAGSTGSGKSVCINGIITSILMNAKPHEVKMMMIDPKMVELNVYNGIPHLLAPVVTDPKRAAQALKKIVNEMERRYELFSATGTRNIEGYNENVRKHNLTEEIKQPQLPFIVVLVDELADLMMVASSDVEDAIIRLAQMARAAGIHLIIATQRPSVDVITGIIKANIPSRIAFAVSSSIDSRTILDMGGAEKLLGRGDMLFFPVGASKPVRVQGAFLSDQEVENIVDYVIAQQKAQYQEEMIPNEVEAIDPNSETDELYNQAVELVVEMQTASVSLLQRRFRIGYSRAARLIDQMEERYVVGPYEGSRPRTVLITKNNEKVD